MITLVEKDQWVSTPTGYLTIKYEASISGTGVNFRFYWKVWLERSTSYYNDELRLDFSIDDEYKKEQTVKSYGTDTGWSKEGYTEIFVPKKMYNCLVKITMRNVTADTVLFWNHFIIDAPPFPSEITSTDEFEIDGNIYLGINQSRVEVVDTLYIKLNGTVVKTIPDVSGGYFRFTEAEKSVIYDMMSDENMASFEFTITSTAGSHTVWRNGRIASAYPYFTNGEMIPYYVGASIQDAIYNGQIVQGLSHLWISIPDATAIKGAYIVRYQVVIGEKICDSLSSGLCEFGTVLSKGDQYITITATDSRGNTGETKQPIYVYEYFKPMFTATPKRKNNYEAETTFKVDAKCASVDGLNAIESISYTVAKVGETHASAIVIENGETHFLTCDQRYAYEFIVTATDKFGQSTTQTVKLAKGKVPLFVDTVKNAVGINAFPMVNEALRVGGGVAVYEDGIVIKSSTKGSAKLFKITVEDNGNLIAIEYE